MKSQKNLLDNHTLRYTISLFITLYFSAYETQSLDIAATFFDKCGYAYLLRIASLLSLLMSALHILSEQMQGQSFSKGI